MPADTLKKLFKRVQDGMDGMADALLGDKTERLLDREVRAIDETLHATRNEHAAAKAQRIATEQRHAAIRAELAVAETKVESLLRQRRSKQARVAAEAVVSTQQRSSECMQEVREWQQREAQFAVLVEQLEHQLRRTKHQLDTVHASVSLQRAQAAVARRQPGPAPHPEPAVVSAARMRQRGKQSSKGANSGTPAPRARKSAGAQQNTGADAVIARIAKRVLSPPAGKGRVRHE